MYNDSLKKLRQSNNGEIINGFVNSELWTKKLKYQVIKNAGFHRDKESLKRFIYAKRGVRQGKAKIGKIDQNSLQNPLEAMDQFKDNYVKNMRIAENPQNMFTAGINFKLDQDGNVRNTENKGSEGSFTKNLIVSRNSVISNSPQGGLQRKVLNSLRNPRTSKMVNRQSFFRKPLI